MFRLCAALAVTVALGLFSRQQTIGWFVYDKSLGDILYAVAAYLCLALVLFRRSVVLVAFMALTFCLAVECFQATGLPARWAHRTIIRWLLGTSFSWHDIGCYFLGVAIITAVDKLLLRPGWGPGR
jgi:hypothetical protein